MQLFAVKCPPTTVLPQHPIGDGYMCMQIGITGTRISMNESDGNKARRWHLSDTTSTHSRKSGNLFAIRQCAPPSRLVDLLHDGADLVVTQRPQQRHRFDRREDQVKPSHRMPSTTQLVGDVLFDISVDDELARLLLLEQGQRDPFLEPPTFMNGRAAVMSALELGIGRGRLLGQRDLVLVLREPAPQPRLRTGLLEQHPGCDPLGNESRRIGTQTLAEQGEHLFFRDDPRHAQIGDP